MVGVMILVTGAGGTVGRALVHELTALGQHLRLAFNSTTKAEEAMKNGHAAVVLDFAQPATVAPALEGIDALFLLATGGLGQAEREAMVTSLAKAAGVRKLVKLSILDAAGEAYAFARIHREAERAVEASGLEWTHLRPNAFMQNFSNFMARPIKTQGLFFEPVVEPGISRVDVRDIARVAARVLTEPGHGSKAYEITGPEPITNERAASELSRALGREIRYVPVSDEAARANMISSGVPEFYADYLVDMFRHQRSGAAARVTSTIRELTGRDATRFTDFVRDHAAAFA